LEIEILRALAQQFNFTYRLKEVADGMWGSKREEGGWSGMVGEVMRGEAHLAMSGITISSSRQTAVDFTFPHWMESSAIAIKLYPHKWQYFITPLKPLVWLILIALPLILAPVSLTLDALRNRVLGNSNRIPLRQKITETLLSFCQCVCNQSLPESPRTLHARFIQGTLWFAVVVIYATYCGNLTASLASHTASWPFRDLDGLAESTEYDLIIQSGSIREDLLMQATSGVYKKLSDKMKQQKISKMRDSSEIFELMRTQKVAYSGDHTGTVMKIRDSGDCDVVILPDTFMPSGIGIAVPKGAVYKKHFDKAYVLSSPKMPPSQCYLIILLTNRIMRMAESGLLNRWNAQNIGHDPCRGLSGCRPVAMVMGDALLVFAGVLGSGLATALLSLMVEIASHRLHKKKTTHVALEMALFSAIHPRNYR
jgi:hypothetical protein